MTERLQSRGVAGVAMSLSKIYRGAEADGLQQFEFRSFGEPDATSSQPSKFTQGTAVSGSSKSGPATGSGPNPRELEEAYARGHRAGLQTAQEQFDTTLETLATALEEVSRLREQLARSSRQDLLRLVMAVAEQVIRREVAADPQILLTILDQALKASVQADQYRILVNPQDRERVNEHKPLFLASISGLTNLSIEGEAKISPGGCRIESDLGEVDATIESQLEMIQQTLNAAIADQS